MVKDQNRHAAFLAYAHSDDVDGRISLLRQTIADEVRAQTGEAFHIFQDEDCILWGESWQRRINDALDSVDFMMPVITPSFFKRSECRSELTRFIDKERSRGTEDSILPIYYISTPLVDDLLARASDPLASAIGERQLADWRDLRLEAIDSPKTRRAVEALARQIKASMDGADESRARGHYKHDKLDGHDKLDRHDTLDNHDNPDRLNKSDMIVVDQMHRGDYEKISLALEAASPGDTIIVHPGLYDEGMVVDDAVEIAGVGMIRDIVVRSRDGPALLFRASRGRVSGITLQGTGDSPCVDIRQGRLDMDCCDITSRAAVCISVRGDADPRIKGCTIHGGGGGFLIREDAKGVFEGNKISGCSQAGVAVIDRAEPRFIANCIIDGGSAGILISSGGRGAFEENVIRNNALAGVEVRDGGDATFRKNHILSGRSAGVLVHSDGRGLFEENEISGNGSAGVVIMKRARPVLRKNRIGENSYKALWIYDGGGGVVEENDLRGNLQGPWDISEECMDGVQMKENEV